MSIAWISESNPSTTVKKGTGATMSTSSSTPPFATVTSLTFQVGHVFGQFVAFARIMSSDGNNNCFLCRLARGMRIAEGATAASSSSPMRLNRSAGAVGLSMLIGDPKPYTTLKRGASGTLMIAAKGSSFPLRRLRLGFGSVKSSKAAFAMSF